MRWRRSGVARRIQAPSTIHGQFDELLMHARREEIPFYVLIDEAEGFVYNSDMVLHYATGTEAGYGLASGAAGSAASLKRAKLDQPGPCSSESANTAKPPSRAPVPASQEPAIRNLPSASCST